MLAAMKMATMTNKMSKKETRKLLTIEPAGPADIAGLVELLNIKHPTAWIKRISHAGLQKFLRYSINNLRSVILMARMDDDRSAGYIFSTFDTKRFWLGFSSRYPVTMSRIISYRLRGLYNAYKRRNHEQGNLSHLPGFSWSPSGPGTARIMGTLVRKEHRGKGVATELYKRLFDALREKKCYKIEEYMGPDYCDFVGKYQDCGWDFQQLNKGYKMVKYL